MTSNLQPVPSHALNIEQIRAEFPILAQAVNGHSLVYLDNGATAQKPKQVIAAINHYYETTNSNVHRGAHYLSDLATKQFEDARSNVQQYINANDRKEIIWTRGTTESINLVAQTWGETNLSIEDEIIISSLEHHSNIVPWQILCEKTGAKLKVVDVKPNGEFNFEHFQELLNDRTKLVAVGHISNALGVINPVSEIIQLAHDVGAKVLIDGAQAMPHLKIDVQQLDCDFYAFSGHKMFGPMGIGVLYAKQELLEAMPPWQAGGEMIEKVSFSKTTYNELPYKFEAGTPNVSGAVGLSAAIDYLESLDRQAITDYENFLLDYATSKLSEIDGLTIIGSQCAKASVVSFNIDGVHAQDLGMMLDQQGIAVRTGHHCAMPLMDALNINGTVRASFSFYNTVEEIDLLHSAINKALSLLR
ncbi:MAG: cysteine desulfurase [Kangiellaceae bacterium]|jgi:cysteine desulfurase / selenocysteine lyase